MRVREQKKVGNHCFHFLRKLLFTFVKAFGRRNQCFRPEFSRFSSGLRHEGPWPSWPRPPRQRSRCGSGPRACRLTGPTCPSFATKSLQGPEKK
jgi:hypothetical protein